MLQCSMQHQNLSHALQKLSYNIQELYHHSLDQHNKQQFLPLNHMTVALNYIPTTLFQNHFDYNTLKHLLICQKDLAHYTLLIFLKPLYNKEWHHPICSSYANLMHNHISYLQLLTDSSNSVLYMLNNRQLTLKSLLYPPMNFLLPHFCCQASTQLHNRQWLADFAPLPENIVLYTR